ncbi:MAG: hypothetical protein KJN79_02355, partial [Gammaproteobacteria bacterium]|nr:hypothetical protein [Gammaproteobacteria bacterium]
TELSSDELRMMVAKKVEELADGEVLEHYMSPVSRPAQVLVTGPDGTASRFSRGKHMRRLQASGLSTFMAEDITGKMYEQLLGNATQSITHDRLDYLTYRCIKEEISNKSAKRFLVWTQFDNGDKPLLLILGGVAGTGKRSIATELAHRLEIVRTPSTDMLREVMRMMMPQRLLPVLHTSSFEAWRCLPVQEGKERDQDGLVAEGFRMQAEMLAVSCEAVLRRAEHEGVSMILEGVHALPSLLETFAEDSEAITVHVTLAVLRSSILKSRLRGRSTSKPKRRAKRYLRNFDSIWSLQTYLLSEADSHDTAIITNDEIEKAIQKVIITVNHELKKHYSGGPAEVFGQVAAKYEEQGGDWKQLVPDLINE